MIIRDGKKSQDVKGEKDITKKIKQNP